MVRALGIKAKGVVAVVFHALLHSLVTYPRVAFPRCTCLRLCSGVSAAFGAGIRWVSGARESLRHPRVADPLCITLLLRSPYAHEPFSRSVGYKAALSRTRFVLEVCKSDAVKAWRGFELSAKGW